MSAAFWDRIAESYAAKPIEDVTAYAATLERVRAFLKPTDRILEIGCGTGGTALKLADAVAEVTATDISGEMIRIAGEKLTGDAPGNVTFRQADADDAITGGPYDAICAFNLLHLVRDPAATLAEVRTRLRPGGLFVSKTPCIGEMPFVLRLVLPVMRALGKAPRLLPLTVDGLTRTIRDAGFEIVESGFFDAKRRSPFFVARAPSV